MDIEKIKTLTDLMVDNDLTEVMIRDGDQRIVLRRGPVGAAPQVVVTTPVSSGPAPLPPSAAAEPALPAAAPEADTGLAIVSPMVGTFYSAPDPDSPAYLNVGDPVNAETVACVIEAMKVFNEIKAEVAGTVVSIEVQNGQSVEFGQVLFRIRAD